MADAMAALREVESQASAKSKFATSEMMSMTRQRMTVLTTNAGVLPIQKRENILSERIGTLPSERGCVEDQPQQLEQT